VAPGTGGHLGPVPPFRPAGRGAVPWRPRRAGPGTGWQAGL